MMRKERPGAVLTPIESRTDLENYRRLVWAEVKILADYPTLDAEDLTHAWAYADANAAEINEAIRQNEAA